MGQDTGQIRQDIEETRGRMGDTVEALGHKADVPGRAREAVSDRVESVKSKISGATPDSGDVKQGAHRAKPNKSDVHCAGLPSRNGADDPRSQGSLSKPSPKPFRLIGKPMPSSGVWKMMKVAVCPVRSLPIRVSSMITSATQPLGTQRTKPARPISA